MRQLKALGAALIPGLLSGIMIVIMSVSLAALIFSGRLSVFIAEGIALAMNTAIITGLGITLFSRCKPVISMVDEDTAPVFALLVSFVVAYMPVAATSEQLYTTALAAIVVTTIVSGVGLALLGVFRFGKFIQFLPHSVMGGYFAAVGWLLIVGGFKVSSGYNFSTWDGLLPLLGTDAVIRWLPAVLMAVFLLVLRNRASSNMLLPGTVLVAVAGWYLVQWFIGVFPDSAMETGLLLGPFSGHNSGLISPLAGLDIAGVNWQPLLFNSGTIASIFLIAVMSMMLCSSGLGILTRTEPDMNVELKVAGLANIASGFGGGMTGLPSYSISSLAIDMGGDGNRWVGVLAILVCALTFLFGLDLVAYTPKFILSGILMYLGLALLREWLIDGRQKFSSLEYLVIPIILLVSIVAGFLQGVLVGLIAAIVLFVVKYSRTRVVRYSASGSQLMSNVDRPAAAQEILRENGDRLLAMGLQGYLFFGTAGQVYDQLQVRLRQKQVQSLQFLIVDFSQVTGLDASAALNFQKILQLSEIEEFCLIISGLEPELSDRLHKGGFGKRAQKNLLLQPDLDRSLEWCENQMLSTYADEELRTGCFEQLSEYLSADETQTLMKYLQERQVEAGHVLAEQGDLSDQLFFLESCAASAYITTEKREPHRVRHTTRGTVFGELGFYLQIPRTASVVTDEAGLVYILDRDSLLRMTENDPEVAAGLNRYMAMLLSERLMFTTRTLRAFLM